MPNSGLARVQRKMLAMAKAGEAAMRLSMEEGAQQIVDTMKAYVAVKSGDLYDSIGWTWGEAPKGSLKIASVRSRRGNMKITIYAGNDKAFYARWVEFGTQAHLIGGMFAGSNHPGGAAQPFFYPAYRINKKPVTRKVNAAVRKAVRKVWASGN